jgi:hypothetical protein
MSQNVRRYVIVEARGRAGGAKGLMRLDELFPAIVHSVTKSDFATSFVDRRVSRSPAAEKSKQARRDFDGRLALVVCDAFAFGLAIDDSLVEVDVTTVDVRHPLKVWDGRQTRPL